MRCGSPIRARGLIRFGITRRAPGARTTASGSIIFCSHPRPPTASSRPASTNMCAASTRPPTTSPYWRSSGSRLGSSKIKHGHDENPPPAHRLGVKERWEAGPPRCLLRRVGLVPTSVNFEGLTEWVWCPPAGGLKSGGPTALPPPSVPAKVPRGPWDRRQLLHVRHEEVFRMTASFTEQMKNDYSLLGILSRGKFSL